MTTCYTVSVKRNIITKNLANYRRLPINTKNINAKYKIMIMM
jgi:hypothetical protein